MPWNIAVISNGYVKDCIMVIGQQTQSKGTLDNEEDKYDDKTKLLNANDGNFINTDT